jgi:hypothetical protein
MKLLRFLDDLELRIKKEILVPGDRETALKTLSRLRAKYASLGTVDEEAPAYVGLCSRLEGALARTPLQKGELAGALSYAAASWYDIAGRLGPYKRYVYAFFGASISFFALSPQFFPPVLPILFVVPVFLAIRGLKRRNRQGFSLSMLVYPVSLLASSAAARAYVPALGDWANFIASQASAYRASPGLAAAISVASILLTVVSFASAIYGSISGFRHRDLFV